MRNSTNRRVVVHRIALLLALALLIPVAGQSAPWDFGANVDLGVIYTDNIFLDVEGEEQSDTVYTIRPELFLTTDGDRIKADIRYRPEAYFYRTNSDANGVFHVVDAIMTSALVRDRLFLDLSGANYQSIISPVGHFPTSNVPISTNRVDTRIFEVRPYWQQRVGSADLHAELSYTDTKYDDEAFQSNNVGNGTFRLNNFRRQQGFAWGVSYDHTRSDYEFSSPWEYQRASANLGYWVTGTTRLFVEGGAETDPDNLLEPNMDETFWEAGFQFTPNQRFNTEAAIGERYYGTSLRVSADYTMRRGSMSFDYNETPSTDAQLPTGRRPIEDTDDLDGALDEPGRSDRFLRRRLDWSMNLELAKSDLTFHVFAEKREDRITSEGEPLEDEQYAGFAVRWSWDIGVNTTFGAGGDYTKRDTIRLTDELRRLKLDLVYNLTQRLNIRAEFLRSIQDGRDDTTFDYVENQVRLLLNTEF